MSRNEVEYLLWSDNRYKKMVGSNIFSRVSTRKGGSRQPLRTPYYFMSNKEKKQLNGKVVTFNMYETILPKHEFEKLDKNTQKLAMTKWRENFKKAEIIKGLGVSSQTYYKMLDELGIPKEEARVNRYEKREVSKKELNEMKNRVVSYTELMSLPKHQRAELLAHYRKKYTAQEIADIMGVESTVIYNLQYRLRNMIDKFNSEIEEQIVSGNNEIKVEENQDIQLETQYDNNETQVTNNIEDNKPTVKENEEVVTPVASTDNNDKIEQSNEQKQYEQTYFSLRQYGNKAVLLSKLNLLIGYVATEKDDTEFEINITIKQKN
jgi:hypothetical protein